MKSTAWRTPPGPPGQGDRDELQPHVPPEHPEPSPGLGSAWAAEVWGGRDRYVPVLSPRHGGVPHNSSLGRGCRQLPEPGVPAGAASGGGQGLGRCYEGALGAAGPSCRSASSRKAKAPPRGRGSVRGSPGAWAGAAPLCKGEVSQGGGHGAGGLSPRCGRPGWSWWSELRRGGCPGPCGPGESQLPGVGSGGGACPGARGSSPGLGQPQEWGGRSSFSRGCGGVRAGALPRGCGQPPLPPVRLPEGSVQLLQLRAQRQVDLQVHAQRLQPLLQLGEGWSE